MEKADGKKILRLGKFAQERSVMKKAKEEERKSKEEMELEATSCLVIDDCVPCILVRLPIQSLQRSICVCKLWDRMIHNPAFIFDHILRSEPVILFQSYNGKKKKAADFSVECSVAKYTNVYSNPVVKHFPTMSIHFMEYVDGKAEIRDFNIGCLGIVMASCNGLILVESRRGTVGGLIVLNPLTRKSIFLRLGTVSLPDKESYGFVYDPSTTQYKVVHLFDDELGHTNCEIMVVGARYWKMVDGPPFGSISWFRQRPVSAIGALHWLPQKLHNEHILSLETGKESFKTIELPVSGGSYDRLTELRNLLCFSTHEEMVFKIGIWVLKSLSEEKWTRLHTVTTGSVMDMVPISGSRSGEHIIFTREVDPDVVYIYDFNTEAVLTIRTRTKGLDPVAGSSLPHVNSLASWSVR